VEIQSFSTIDNIFSVKIPNLLKSLRRKSNEITINFSNKRDKSLDRKGKEYSQDEEGLKWPKMNKFVENKLLHSQETYDNKGS